MALIGADISHHNGKNAVETVLNKQKGTDFIMVKATEGKTYVDPMFDKNASDVINNGLLLGIYHYARPENNSPSAEAANFLAQFRKFLGIAIPVLDWEDVALNYSEDWALEWCDCVYESTGVRPMIYVQHSAIKSVGILAEHNYGLWVARWRDTNDGVGTVAPWSTWAMWQYTNSPFDKNLFNGSKAQFQKYCQVNKTVRPDDEVKDGGHTCGCSCCEEGR